MNGRNTDGLNFSNDDHLSAYDFDAEGLLFLIDKIFALVRIAFDTRLKDIH